MAETLVPGANVSAIARREGIAPSQLFGWRRQAIRNGTVTPPETEGGPHFDEGDTAVSSAIEIVLEGAVVRVGADVPEGHLRRVIRALRST